MPARTLSRSALAFAAAGCLVFAGACSEESVFDLSVGDCFADLDDLTGGGEVDTVTTIDCDEPHAAEVFALFDIPGDDFPGALEVGSQADAGCLERFDGDDPSSITYLTPSQQSWDELDDREVVCIELTDPTGGVGDDIEETVDSALDDAEDLVEDLTGE